MYSRCEVLCKRCRRFFGIAVDEILQQRKKKRLVKNNNKTTTDFAYVTMCSILACHRTLLSTVRPSRRCSVIFSIVWPSSDGLYFKTCCDYHWLCFYVIIMSIWLAMHHIEIRLRQSCSYSWIRRMVFPVAWSVVSSASVWNSTKFNGISRGRTT